jgi:hypothetical protein
MGGISAVWIHRRVKRPYLLALAVLVVLLAVPAPAQAAFPGQNGRIAFVRPDPVVGGDNEIWTMNPDGSSQTKLTDNTVDDIQPTWSPDGKWIAFASKRDGNYEIYVMSGSGGSQTRITSNPATDLSPTWSPGGDQLAFSSDRDSGDEIYKMNANGSSVMRLTTNTAPDDSPTWSYEGSKIAFVSVRSQCPGSYMIWTMNPDGSGQNPEFGCNDTDYYDPTWAPRDDPQYAPNQLVLGYFWSYYDVWGAEAMVYYMNFPYLAGGYEYYDNPRYLGDGTWSPDGNWVAYLEQQYGLQVVNISSSGYYSDERAFNPDWQPVVPGYPRPLSASPAAVQLVPAQEPCTSANGTHNAPLTATSCSPSVQTSDYLTVGGADGQPSAAKFHGVIDFTALPGNAATLADEADVRINVNLKDVRRRSDYLDYEGEVLVSLPLRITDRWNGPSLNQTGTAQDLSLSFPVGCTATSDSAIGSSCTLTTTADAVAPGAVREGKRANWELGQVQVYDGGADGDADTAGDNTLFAVQGLFAP